MRLDELFAQTTLTEAPIDNVNAGKKLSDTDKSEVRTITFAASEVYLMTLQEIPKIKDPRTGQMATNPDTYKEFTYEIGTGPGQINPKLADTLTKWRQDGSVPGMMRNDKGELDTYDKNSYAYDIGLTLLGATIELGANLTRAGAIGADYVVNGTIATTDIILNKYANLDVIDAKDYNKMRLTDLATGSIGDQMWMDEFSDAINDMRDKQFTDDQDITAGAINSWSDVASFVTGTSGASWGGAFALMAGELPSEIVDVALLAGTSWWTGGALNVAFNAAEASGAAAKEMQRQINKAHEEGILQQTAQWQMYMKAANDQITEDGTVFETEQERMDAIEKLAMDQTVYAAYHNGLWKIAATAGVLDSVADRLMVKPPIKTKHVFGRGAEIAINAGKKGSRVAKGAVVEMGQEALEQYIQNLAVISATGDQLVTTETAGVLNAAYNSIYGTAASGVAQTGLSVKQAITSPKTRASMAALRKFYAGKSTLRELFFGTSNNPEMMAAAAMNQETGQLDLLGMLKKRDADFKTVADLSEKDRKAVQDGTFKGRYFTIDGKRYDRKLILQNSEDAELMQIFQDSVNDTAEGKIRSTFQSEEDAIKAAKILGLYEKKMDINQVMAKLEDFTKIDVRIAGSSTLEAPLWSELTALQKRQFVTDGKVTFQNHPERGNQEWSRDKVLYTSRINGETIPSEVQNLADNVEARPNENSFGSADEAGSGNEIRKAESDAYQEMRDDREFWDEEFGQTHNADGSPKDPNAEGIAGRQLTDDDLGIDGTNGARPARGQEYYDNLAKDKLASNVFYQNALERNKKYMEDLAVAQEEWDEKYSETHNNNGAAKIDSAFIDGAPVGPGVSTVASDGSPGPEDDTDTADEPLPVAQTDAPDGTQGDIESDETGQETLDADDSVITPITPDDLEGDIEAEDAPSVFVQPPTLSNDKKVAMDQIVYRMKMNMAEGGYEDADALKRTLDILEMDFPGITQRVVPDGIESYKSNNNSAKEKAAEEVENTEAPVYTPSTRPPKGTEVELNGQTYRFLGRMWAPVKPDGKLGSTGHKNHKELNKIYTDQQTVPDTAPPGFSKVEGAETAEVDTTTDPTDQQDTDTLDAMGDAETGTIAVKDLDTEESDWKPDESLPPSFDKRPDALDIIPTDTTTQTATTTSTQTAQDQEGGVGGTDGEVADVTGDDAQDQEIFDPSAPTDNDRQYADVEVPQKVQDDYAEVLATNNAIKVNDFLEKLPADQAGSLRMNPPTVKTEPEVTVDPKDQQDTDTLDAMGDTDPVDDTVSDDPPTVTTTAPEQPKLGDTPNLDSVTTVTKDDPIKFVEPDKLDPAKVVDGPASTPQGSPIPPNVTTTAPEKPAEPETGDELDITVKPEQEPKIDTTKPELQQPTPPDDVGDIAGADDNLPATTTTTTKGPEVDDKSPEQPKGPQDMDPTKPGFQSQPPKTDVEIEPTTKPEIVDPTPPDQGPIIPPAIKKPDANVTVGPDAKTTTTTKTDTDQDSRKVRPGMKGKPKPPADWEWNLPDFNKFDFRDPLNLMKYKGADQGGVYRGVQKPNQRVYGS